MGKKVAVGSAVFPLMGSEDRQPHYLKSLIISGIQVESYSIADAIKEGYRNSPAIRIRNFYNWAQKDEEFQKRLGITSGTLQIRVKIDHETLVAELPQVPGRTYQIVSAYVGQADILLWAEQWIAEHYPDRYDTDWECDYNSKTKIVTITFEDGTTEEFKADSFYFAADYLYVKYIPYQKNEDGEVQKGNLEIFIYHRGSGNEVLDSFFWKTTTAGGFYPTIPLRYDNAPITGEAYELCKKAYRKAFNQDYDEVFEQINNHENVEDIDYAVVAFGVPLNIKDNTAKKYIYKFFQYLIMHQLSQSELEEYMQATGENAPPPMGLFVKSVHKEDNTVNFQNYYEWRYLTEERGTGILKERKKKGDLWFEKVDNSTVALCWQETSNRWRKITAYNLVHKNQFYEGKEVVTKAVDAINDEKTSKFIIPLHEDVYHSLSLVDRTQMVNTCAYLVFNYYEEKEPSFWEEWLPTIITAAVVILTVVITVVTGGAGIGLLGSAEIVGASLGFTGTTALIVGATINTLAALLVAHFISEVAIEMSVIIFGEKWGRVIGAIVAAILTIGISAGVNSANIVNAFTKADNLIKISQATTNAYSNYLKASAIELNEQAQKMQDETSKKISHINKLREELYGFREIDPTHVDEYISKLMEWSELTERMEDFLARTLLTGSDIAEIQRQFITNFVKNTITTKLP